MEFCHVGIIGMDGKTIIEARWPKVKIGPLDIPDLETRNPIDFYRVKGITPARAAEIVANAQKDIGKWYDLGAIFTMGVIQLGHAGVCSQYVWKWFIDSGIVLCPMTSFISPDDIASSTLTEKIEP